MNQNNSINILGINESAYDCPTVGDVLMEPIQAIPDSTTTTTAAMMYVGADARGKRKRSGQHKITSSNKTTSSISHAAATANSSATHCSDKSTKIKKPRINWAISPHREYLAQVLHDWFSRTGLAVDATTKEPITDYKIYADKVGISPTTLFKYIRKDTSKRRIIKENIGRGKKRLIDEEGMQCIVTKLKAKADASNGFSRQEAISMIVAQFGISRKAATRQFILHILPRITINDRKLIGSEYRGGNGGEEEDEEKEEDDDWIGEKSILPNSSERKQPHSQQSKQPIRSIVISGVTSGRGRELFEYFCNHGHNVAGCGVVPCDIRALQIQFPQSKLDVVDTKDFEAVEQWSSHLDASGMDFDLIIANPGPGQTCRSPAWEMTRDNFDSTMDANVKGIYNMIRHFVPKLIQKSNGAATPEGVHKERVFVAMSSSLGVRLDPFLAAHCASAMAVDGLMRCVAISIPEPLSAVTFDPSVATGPAQYDKLTSVDDEDGRLDSADDASQWVNAAAPMLLRLNRGNNGKSMSIQS